VLAIRTILYPTDFSDRCRPAFELACALARDYGATLVVVHVVQLPFLEPVEGVLVPTPIDEAEADRGRLEQVRPADPRVAVCHRLAEGDPAEEILRIAAGEKADLIVMGTHGRTGLARLLVGSVAEAVLRQAPCPVLTVKEPPPAVAEPRAAAPERAAARTH
jgi:nucleotide-binding universal stress UspA family protein